MQRRSVRPAPWPLLHCERQPLPHPLRLPVQQARTRSTCACAQRSGQSSRRCAGQPGPRTAPSRASAPPPRSPPPATVGSHGGAHRAAGPAAQGVLEHGVVHEKADDRRAHAALRVHPGGGLQGGHASRQRGRQARQGEPRQCCRSRALHPPLAYPLSRHRCSQGVAEQEATRKRSEGGAVAKVLLARAGAGGGEEGGR